MLIDNIIASADVANQEYRIFLCRMDKTVIRELTSSAYAKSYTSQLGGADEFSFNIDKKYDGKPVLNYDDIVGRNFIKIQQKNKVLGFFEIQSISTANDGIKETKQVKCYSLEIKLINKYLYLTQGTFKLVNNSDPSKGLLNLIASKCPSWNIGYIDSSLLSKERYFDISSISVLELLLSQCQIAYECVFVFDTVTNTINTYALANYGRQSKIIVSSDNIINSADIEVLSKEVVTRLYLYGDNEISVYDVNLGQPYIQNFNYYKNTRYMSQSLINALNTYDAKVASYQVSYTNYIAQLTSLNATLETYENDLLVLQNELATLEKTKSYLESTSQSLVAINAQIASKNTEITSKQNQINSTNGQIASINTAINGIVTALLLSNNFTTIQIKELDNFIIEDTYQDSAYLITDSSTYQDKINVENALLDAGKNILARVSAPRYKIDIDIIDFLKCEEFASWWEELYIGDIVRLDIDGFVVSVRVVGYTHDWDNNKLTIQLGDKYQLDDANIEMLDLLKSSISAGTSIDFERFRYKDYTQNNKNEILEFINSSIDASKNAIVSGTNVGIKIDGSGILATALIPNTLTVSPNQLRVSNNSIVLSNDSFTTAKMAIGQLANGLYGVAAEVIAGKMILGNNMIIETGNGDFRVDGSGVNITKMSLNMTSANNLQNILIDPNAGFAIRTRPNISSGWTNNFYVDTGGNLQIRGNLLGATGSFSGSINASSFIGGSINIGNGRFTVDSSGNMNSVSATITGSIVGSTIVGSNINGNVINGGTINGTVMNGGNATFGTGYKVNISTDNFGSGGVNFLNQFSSQIGYVKADSSGGIDYLNLYSNMTLGIGANQNINLSAFGNVNISGSYVNFSNIPYVSDISGRKRPIALRDEINNYTEGVGISILGNQISTDQSYFNQTYCRNSGGYALSFQIYNTYLEVFNYGTYIARVPLDFG